MIEVLEVVSEIEGSMAHVAFAEVLIHLGSLKLHLVSMIWS